MRKPIDSKAGDEKEARLRERLRAGDPAAGTEPLATEEVQAMRRALLGAEPEAWGERRSAPWFRPLLAGAALAALAGIGVMVYAGLGRGPAPDGQGSQRVAAGGTPEVPAAILGPKHGSPSTASGSGPGGSGDIGPGAAPGASSPGGAEAQGGIVAPRYPVQPSVRSAVAPRRAERPASGPAPSRVESLPLPSGSELAALPAADPGSGSTPSVAPNAPVAPAIRELQFSAPGGTRIVWVFASGDAPIEESPRPARL